MNKVAKKKWIAALRSGKFKQGVGMLRSNNKDYHCCLGVLCEVLQTDAVLKEEALNALQGSAFLPPLICEILNMESDPTVIFGKCTTSLAAMNDGGYKFEKIADIIEGQL